MAEITVEKIDDETFKVKVKDNSSETTHQVTMLSADYERLRNKKCTPEEFVKKSFEFLLEREPKESILSCFNITVISRYFPEFESEIRKKL